MRAVPDTIKLGMQLINSGQMNQAGDLCIQMLRGSENHSDAYHLLGIIAHKKGKPRDAISFISKAIENNSHRAVYYYHLGYILAELGEFDPALIAYKQAICLKPDYAEAINNLGLILYDKDKIEESIIFFKKALQLKPDFTNAYYNLGNALQNQGNPLAAIEAYDQVLKILPDSAPTRFNRSISLLLSRNFEEGWVEYEWRFTDLNGQKKYNKKGVQRWDGTIFPGKRLLVIDEQGLGDTLQFIRYLPMVKKLGGTVIFETSQPLIRLLAKFNGIDELLDRSTFVRSELAFDLFIPLMSLPGIFKTNLETIPNSVPYIFPDSAKVQFWRQKLVKDKLKIGIVWSGKTSTDYRNSHGADLEPFHLGWVGKPANNFASKRSIRLESFAQRLKIEGIHLYGLQKGDAAIQTQELAGLVDIDNLGEQFADFSDTAAVIANLDLVISVDTSVAHLAGAMGIPVWVLIPYAPDWRWLLEREDSPWYPSMRLFRQSKHGKWDEVFQQIAGALGALVHQ